jgi:DNA-binding XRE family transcriptional regulator
VNLHVVCDKAKMAKVKAALLALNCTVKSVKAPQSEAPGPRWLAIEDLFPNHRAGNAIRGARCREDLTQRQLAALVGISVPNLSHMENGRRPVGKEMAKRLAKALNTDWRLLLD